ncbi:hypothetical protein GPALN_004200 [Globodera pallida]|nr:hypothetical protein GPALN_004200 [Globodera pallida]
MAANVRAPGGWKRAELEVHFAELDDGGWLFRHAGGFVIPTLRDPRGAAGE